MRHKVYALLGCIWMIVSLTACSQTAEGPQVWLDRPLDTSTYPLAPLTIQAHASDSNGVGSIEFYANDLFLSSVNGNGGRFSEASIEWTPPGAGTYTVKARAVDSDGNAGGDATSVVIIDAAMSLLNPTSAATPTASATVDTDPLCRLEQLVAPELLEPTDGADTKSPVHFVWRNPALDCHPHNWRIDISELPDFSDTGWGFGTLDHLETSRDWSLPAGNCYYWQVLAYTPDDYGPPSAARCFCIPATSTVTSTPTLLLPATLTPTLPPAATITPTLVVDTTPPFFINTKVDPDKILTDGNGCPSYARTTIVEAHVVDTGSGSAIASVWALWSVGGESGQVPLSAIGGDYYQGAIGPVNTIGTLNITIYAQDMAGNRAQSGTLYVTVEYCVQ